MLFIYLLDVCISGTVYIHPACLNLAGRRTKSCSQPVNEENESAQGPKKTKCAHTHTHTGFKQDCSKFLGTQICPNRKTYLVNAFDSLTSVLPCQIATVHQLHISSLPTSHLKHTCIIHEIHIFISLPSAGLPQT